MELEFNPNIKIGVLGGGQLGRMLIQEAINFNFNLHLLDKAESPCEKYAAHYTRGDILNYSDVYNFGKNLDILTIEIENVNVKALYDLEKEGIKVYPQPRVIELIQDKGKQKEFYTANDFPTSEYYLINSAKEIETHLNHFPFMQKLRKGGYDGKGVQALKTKEDLTHSFDAPSVLEKFVDLDKELSVIVARTPNKETKCFPLVEQEFNEEVNLVEFLFSPANVSETIESIAKNIAKEIIEKLDMIGILAVEFFLDKSGNLLVNEIAPRPHNSGHQTIEGNYTSQFEQHLRAITNLPLGNTEIIHPSVMINLLGEKNEIGPAKYIGIREAISIQGVTPHLYGKNETKPYRKMGHVTVINSDLNKAKEIALNLKDSIKIIGK